MITAGFSNHDGVGHGGLMKNTKTFRRGDQACGFGVLLVITLLCVSSVYAQSSASFEISQSNLNFGGRPGNTAGPGTSASFQLSLDALGGGPNSRPMSSASYGMHAGFVTANAPPGNASGLIWLNKTDMEWNAGNAAVAYNVYRDNLNTLPGLGYGLCFASEISGLGAQDLGIPTVGNAYFYLVAAENRLGEESSKGSDSAGATRGGNACP